MRRRAALAALLLIGAAPPPAEAPDGAKVVRTPAVKGLLQKPGLVILDVSPRKRRPYGLAPGAPWLPPPHRDIPRSIWIPGAGADPIPPALDHYFRDRLARLTFGDRHRPILVYCHPHCAMSRNAARRVLGYGYRNVFWYPDGIEGWQDAGMATAPAAPQGPQAPAVQSPAR